MAEMDHINSILEQLGQHASVETVYGDPIEHGDKTVIPVVKVGYGFGGGYGTNEEDEGASGGGGGGGMSATPIGVVELTADRTQFVRFESRKRLLKALTVGIIVGLLWGRRG